MATHMMIPDAQVRHGVPLDHLDWVGRYMVEKKPDVVVNIGDFADMPSLSSWDRGKKKFEGRRYMTDIKATHKGMDTLMRAFNEHNGKKKAHKLKQYKPRLVMTLGNHEQRIERAVEENCAVLDSLISYFDLKYEQYGWEVHDFLKPVNIDGILYAHYFYNPMSGRPYGGMIENRIKLIGSSFTMGHQQTLMHGIRYTTKGEAQHGLVAGSCYLHDEDYKGHQGNAHWRGIIMKHEVSEGKYDPMFVSLDYLCRRYEQMSLKKFMLEKYGDQQWSIAA